MSTSTRTRNAPANRDYQSAAQQGNGKSLLARSHQLITALTPELARALPRGMDADRMARIVYTEVRKSRNAKEAGIAKHAIDECTQESITGCLLTSSAMGLEPGVQGECYLIPYENRKLQIIECTLIIGYQGIVKLFWNHPRAQGISCEAIYENDTIIEYTKGVGGRFVYQPTLGERGKIIAYYAEVKIAGVPDPLWGVFTPAEIKALRRGKEGSSGDIKDPQHWMERKTALKQVLKLAPKTSRLDMAVRLDEHTGSELVRARSLELPAGVTPAVGSSPEPADNGGGYVEGEVIPDSEQGQVPIDPPPDVHMISTEQLAKLEALFKAEKTNDKRTQLGWCAQIAGRGDGELTELGQLTADEAAQCIAELETPLQTAERGK